MKRRAAAWAIADQGLSGLSNILLLIFVARSSGSAEFGGFSVLYAIYATALSLQRAAVGQATLIRPKTADSDSPAARLSLGAGAVFGVALFAVAAWLPVPLAMVAVLGAALPVLQLQDILRFVRLRDGQSHVAAASDAIWCSVSIALFVAATLTGNANATVITAAWVVGGICACACLTFAPAATPLRGGVSTRIWLSQRRTLVGGLGIDTLMPAVAGNASLVVLAAIGGPSAVAQIRAADALTSPLLSFTTALGLIMLARMSRQGIVRRVVMRDALGLGLIACAYCVGLLLLPQAAGRSLLGKNWSVARDVLPVMSVGYVAASLVIPLVATLKAQELVRRFLLLRLSGTVGYAAGIVGGAVVAAGPGAAVGASISRVGTCLLALGYLRPEAPPATLHDAAKSG